MRLRHRCAFGALLALALLHCVAGSAAAAPARVTRIEVDLSLDIEHGVLEETVDLTVTGQGHSSLAFSIGDNLNVERVSASAGLVDHQKLGDRVRVVLDPPLDGQRTLTFRVSGNPAGVGGSRISEDGAVLDPLDRWYPGLPEVRAECRVRVRAPSGWTAIAPGETRGDGSDGIWEWDASRPVRSVAVAAAPNLVVSRDEASGVPVRFVAPRDFPARKRAMRSLSDPMAWLAAALAPYPYDGFNLVMMEGSRRRVRASGMMILPATTPVSGSADAADALAGQWFGEIVPGDGPWIRAFAAWQAVTYARDRGLPLPAELDSLRKGYFSLRPSRDVPLAEAAPDAPGEVLRGKGSAAPDMIRLALGSHRFPRILEDLFGEPVDTPLTLADLVERFERSSGRSLDRVFRDWFRRRGAPEMEASLRTFPASRGGWRVDLTVRQTGESYRMPVDVVFHGPGKRHRESIEVNGESTMILYVLDFEPRRVELDPLGKIFWRKAILDSTP